MPKKTVSNKDVECSNTTTPDYGIITTKKRKKKKEREGIYHCRDSS